MRTEVYTGPKRIGPYEVHGEISSGGMGRVHVGRRLGASGFQKPVAIKRLLPMLATDPDFARSFVEEAHLAARVTHRNIVPTLDLYKEATEVLLIMELVVGSSLEEMATEMRRRDVKMPVPIVVSILLDVLAGLHAMHSVTDPTGRALGILHRDISPHNVLVGLDGTARLVDFGIAKVFSNSEGTNTHTVKGKLAYMAPEQMLLMPLGPRADLYSVGILAWELLVNKRFRGGMNRVEEALFALTGEGVKMPGQVLGDPSLAPIDAILKKVLATEPSDRYESAAEMAAALENAVVAARSTQVAAWVAEWGAKGVERLNGLVRAMGDPSAGMPADAPSDPQPNDGPTQVSVTKGMAEGRSASGGTLSSPRVRAALGAVIAASLAMLVVVLVQSRDAESEISKADPPQEPPRATSPAPTAETLPTVTPIEPTASAPIASATTSASAIPQATGRIRIPGPPPATKPTTKKPCPLKKVFNPEKGITELREVCS